MISVVIPTYNRAGTLKRAVDSVLAQSYRDIELIIVDDASNDQTSEYLAELQSTVEIKVLYNSKNLGVSACRNRGIEIARGEWIAFLDSDDEWLPQKLSEQIKFLNEANKSYVSNPELRLVYTEEIWIRNGVRVNAMAKHFKSGGRIFKRCVDVCFIAPSSVMIHKSLFADVGLFREDFPVCEDYELWLRISAFEDVGYIEEPLIKKYGGHEDQLSKTIGMDLWRVRAALPFVLERFHEEYSSDLGVERPTHVRDLLKGLESADDFYHLITPEEREHALMNIAQRLEILEKGAKKHSNLKLLGEIEKIKTQLSQ